MLVFCLFILHEYECFAFLTTRLLNENAIKMQFSHAHPLPRKDMRKMSRRVLNKVLIFYVGIQHNTVTTTIS